LKPCLHKCHRSVLQQQIFNFVADAPITWKFRKKEEGRRKREEGRGKKEEGRRKI
jgi:hypothetical protein